MDIVRLRLELVYPAKDVLRAVRADAVRELALSLSAIGQQNPITVQPCTRIRNGVQAGAWEVIAGRHRVEAANQLNWTHIDGIVFDGDAAKARMWEISENLHRADLTALERDQHVAEWVRLAGVSAQPVQKPGRPTSGFSNAAREIGVNRMDASRATKVAGLSANAKQAAIDLGLDDNRTALLKAAQAPAEKQADELRRLAAEKATPSKHTRSANKQENVAISEAETEWRDAIDNLWRLGTSDWRARSGLSGTIRSTVPA